MATQAAYRAFRRAYSTGHDASGMTENAARYAHLWAMYENTVFDDLAVWAYYKSRYGLYRHVRSIYNPVRRLADFYAGIVYPGVLTVDPDAAPFGAQSAIPFADDTDPDLLAAVAQLWQWSNWQTGLGIMITYGAAMGDVAIEVVDDVRRGLVHTSVLWPWMLSDLDLDATGNVKGYAVEYDYYDEEARRTRTYRKEVDGERIATYRDDALYAYGEGVEAEYTNPYGFAPLVWVKHKDTGGDRGKPAIRNMVKVDELNSLASHAFDHAHKIMAAPILVSGDNVTIPETTKAAATEAGDRTKEAINLMTASGGGSVSTILLPEGDTIAKIQLLLDGVERDHPELTFYEKLREQQQVSGPGAEAMSGDVAMHVLSARASYDTQSVKLFQMAAAIGGYRANSGAWGRTLNSQQRKFAPFDLASYDRGELDLQIMPRPIVPLSPLESIEIERQRLALEQERMATSAAARTVPQQVADRLRAVTAAA